MKDFEQQYGVKVRIPEGISTKREQVAGRSGEKRGIKIGCYRLVCCATASGNGAKALAKVDDLPGYGDAIHQIQNVDTRGYAVAFLGQPDPDFAYDPQQMGDRALPQTLEQLQSFIDANPKSSAITTRTTAARGFPLSSASSLLRATRLTAKRALTRQW